MPFAFLFAVYVTPLSNFDYRASESHPLSELCYNDSGMLSTILLYMVDVEKSRKECQEFIAAEAKRELFSTSHFDAVTVRSEKVA